MLKLVGLVVCFFLHVNCELVRASKARNMAIPFYQLYTPTDIANKAEFITRYSKNTATSLIFHTDSSSHKRLFRLNLLPSGILSRYADIVVEITLGLDGATRKAHDSDPKFFLSDGINGIGFEMRDETGFLCRGLQATMGNSYSSSRLLSGPTHHSSTLQEQFILSFKPSQHWGSCYSASNSGVITPVSYTHSIFPNQGMWLEMYKEDGGEKYTINYIKVEIHEN